MNSNLLSWFDFLAYFTLWITFLSFTIETKSEQQIICGCLRWWSLRQLGSFWKVAECLLKSIIKRQPKQRVYSYISSSDHLAFFWRLQLINATPTVRFVNSAASWAAKPVLSLLSSVFSDGCIQDFLAYISSGSFTLQKYKSSQRAKYSFNFSYWCSSTHRNYNGEISSRFCCLYEFYRNVFITNNTKSSDWCSRAFGKKREVANRRQRCTGYKFAK